MFLKVQFSSVAQSCFNIFNPMDCNTPSFPAHHQLLVHLKLEKAVAPHSSTLAWKTPWTEEPGRLQSMGSLWVGHDWATSLSFFTFMPWRRKWQPNPVFLPGESQGRGSLVGCRLWGRTEGHDWSNLAAAVTLNDIKLWCVSCSFFVSYL